MTEDDGEAQVVWEKFAAAAMLGLMGAPDDSVYSVRGLAEKAYAVADAMMAERKRRIESDAKKESSEADAEKESSEAPEG